MEVLTLGEPSGSEEGGGDAGKARPDACSSTRAFRIPTGHGAEPDTSAATTSESLALCRTRRMAGSASPAHTAWLGVPQPIPVPHTPHDASETRASIDGFCCVLACLGLRV
eukprot:2965301-Rhodomonas_salina.1